MILNINPVNREKYMYIFRNFSFNFCNYLIFGVCTLNNFFLSKIELSDWKYTTFFMVGVHLLHSISVDF